MGLPFASQHEAVHNTPTPIDYRPVHSAAKHHYTIESPAAPLAAAHTLASPMDNAVAARYVTAM